MNQPLVDIGVNLTSKQFRGDVSDVIARALAADVRYLIVTGLSSALSQAALELARSRPEVLCCTAGVHPHNARTFDRHTRAELRHLASDARVVAVGECGLDYDRDFSPRDQQRAAFEAQLELATELGKPVFLHQRRAHEDFEHILRQHRPRLAGGVVHCFTGDERELDCYLELGLCIGITGFICDERRGQHLERLVRRIPEHRLMVETDAPFLLPRDLEETDAPFLLPRDLEGASGRRNEPAYLPHVARRVAHAMGLPEDELRRRTTATAFQLFGLAKLFGEARAPG